MSGSMGDPRTKKSIGWNYIGAHNNLLSAVWNQAPGGFYVSQQPNDPSAPFSLTPTIGTGKKTNTSKCFRGYTGTNSDSLRMDTQVAMAYSGSSFSMQVLVHCTRM